MLHLALALHLTGDPRGELPAVIRRAISAGADPASCFGLAALDGARRGDGRTVREFVQRFDARAGSGTEALRRVIHDLLRNSPEVQKARRSR